MHIPVQDSQNGAGSPPPDTKVEGVSGGRAELVLAMVKRKQALILLRALRDALPYEFDRNARRGLLYLLLPADQVDQAVEQNVRPRDVMEARYAALQQEHDDIAALLDALPLRFANPGADRALSRLATLLPG